MIVHLPACALPAQRGDAIYHSNQVHGAILVDDRVAATYAIRYNSSVERDSETRSWRACTDEAPAYKCCQSRITSRAEPCPKAIIGIEDNLAIGSNGGSVDRES